MNTLPNFKLLTKPSRKIVSHDSHKNVSFYYDLLHTSIVFSARRLQLGTHRKSSDGKSLQQDCEKFAREHSAKKNSGIETKINESFV